MLHCPLSIFFKTLPQIIATEKNLKTEFKCIWVVIFLFVNTILIIDVTLLHHILQNKSVCNILTQILQFNESEWY